MRRSGKVAQALMPRVRQQILGATLMHPDREWYAAELAHHLRSRPSTLQRELISLTNAGILKTRRQGRMIYYQADSDSPIYAELRALITKTVGLVDVVHR